MCIRQSSQSGVFVVALLRYPVLIAGDHFWVMGRRLFQPFSWQSSFSHRPFSPPPQIPWEVVCFVHKWARRTEALPGYYLANQSGVPFLGAGRSRTGSKAALHCMQGDVFGSWHRGPAWTWMSHLLWHRPGMSADSAERTCHSSHTCVGWPHAFPHTKGPLCSIKCIVPVQVRYICAEW